MSLKQWITDGLQSKKLEDIISLQSAFMQGQSRLEQIVEIRKELDIEEAKLNESINEYGKAAHQKLDTLFVVDGEKTKSDIMSGIERNIGINTNVNLEEIDTVKISIPKEENIKVEEEKSEIITETPIVKEEEIIKEEEEKEVVEEEKLVDNVIKEEVTEVVKNTEETTNRNNSTKKTEQSLEKTIEIKNIIEKVKKTEEKDIVDLSVLISDEEEEKPKKNMSVPEDLIPLNERVEKQILKNAIGSVINSSRRKGDLGSIYPSNVDRSQSAEKLLSFLNVE